MSCQVQILGRNFSFNSCCPRTVVHPFVDLLDFFDQVMLLYISKSLQIFETEYGEIKGHLKTTSIGLREKLKAVPFVSKVIITWKEPAADYSVWVMTSADIHWLREMLNHLVAHFEIRT